MATLVRVSTEHRERLMAHVEALPHVADSIGRIAADVLATRVADEYDFLVGTLIPHMETVEEAVYPELDRLLSCRLAMAPMQREHAEVRSLVDRLGVLSGRLQGGSLSDPEEVELNRVLVRLYAILKVHLREESLYLPILEHNLTPEQTDVLALAMEHAVRVEL
jgi:Hemerythrin HHE cation binding domain